MISKLIFFLVITFASTAGAGNVEQLEQGQAAFNAKEYKQAYKIWHTLAINGYVDAQVFVGLAHKNGWGVNKDLRKATRWMQIAAEGGNSSAQFFLGLQYITSTESKKVDIGLDWLIRAADNGDVGAKNFLMKARKKEWLDIPNTVQLKAINTQITTDNINKVLSKHHTRLAEKTSRQKKGQR